MGTILGIPVLIALRELGRYWPTIKQDLTQNKKSK